MARDPLKGLRPLVRPDAVRASQAPYMIPSENANSYAIFLLTTVCVVEMEVFRWNMTFEATRSTALSRATTMAMMTSVAKATAASDSLLFPAGTMKALLAYS